MRSQRHHRLVKSQHPHQRKVIPSLSIRCPSPGFCEGNPAELCRKIAEEVGLVLDLLVFCAAVRVYYKMTGSRCCSNKGTDSGTLGWMRVANLDMTDPGHVCPAGMFLVADARNTSVDAKSQWAACPSSF